MDRTGTEARQVEVRRRNPIPADAMPYDTQIKTRDGAIKTYDLATIRRLSTMHRNAQGMRASGERQNAARSEGRYIGIGVANYAEGTGRGPFESAIVRVKPSGKMWSIPAQPTRVDCRPRWRRSARRRWASPWKISRSSPATPSSPPASGRSLPPSRRRSSVHVASLEVRNKALKVAAHMLEAAEEDLEIADGRISVRGVSDVSVSLGDVARAVQGMPGFSLPGGVDPGMEATANFSPPTLTYCNGVHVVEVEVDPGTGNVDILTYVIVHDSGRLINPTIGEGQITGGATRGLGSALFERMIYDDQGQPQTTNFGEYLLPSAPEVPSYDIMHIESPTPLNPLGVKGAGEGGTIPVTSAIASAVDDALTDFGVVIRELPIEPKRIVEMIRESAT